MRDKKERLVADNNKLQLANKTLYNIINKNKLLGNERNKKIINQLRIEMKAKESRKDLFEERKQLENIHQEIN